MKEQFISRLLCEPQNIDPARGRTIISSLLLKLRNERPEEDYCGDPLPKMQILGDMAIVPIVGVLQMNVPDWVKKYGINLTDANDIEEEITQALARPEVRMIILHVDSPGGSAIAGNKIYDLVESARKQKPVFAFSGDGQLICSAAYDAAAPCNAIYTGPYSCVGSIGSYLAFLDDTEFWKMMGVTWEVFRSGDFKGIGEDEISKKQRDYLQSKVDEAGARFRSNVARYRTGIAASDMQGQWWNGSDAALRGFSAGTVKDLSAAMTKFRAAL